VVLVVILGLVGFSVGAAIGLAPASQQVFLQSGVKIALAAGLTIMLVPPIAFFASAGHGYLPPIGIMIAAMGLAQIVAAIGYGEYFPWSVPMLYSQGTDLGIVSYVIVLLTGIVGLAGTLIWWEQADQTY
jgi:hypothetical protein